MGRAILVARARGGPPRHGLRRVRAAARPRRAGRGRSSRGRRLRGRFARGRRAPARSGRGGLSAGRLGRSHDPGRLVAERRGRDRPVRRGQRPERRRTPIAGGPDPEARWKARRRPAAPDWSSHATRGPPPSATTAASRTSADSRPSRSARRWPPGWSRSRASRGSPISKWSIPTTSRGGSPKAASRIAPSGPVCWATTWSAASCSEAASAPAGSRTIRPTPAPPRSKPSSSTSRRRSGLETARVREMVASGVGGRYHARWATDPSRAEGLTRC